MIFAVGEIRRQKLFGKMNLFCFFSDYISETGFKSKRKRGDCDE